MTALWVALVSMAPVVELRGGIPLGIGLGLSPLEAVFWATLGNLLVVPLLLWLLPRVVEELSRWPRFRRAWEALERRVRLKGEEQVQRLGALGLFLFVAVPLPGTGAWSGSVLAVVLGVRKRYALPAIALGVVAAGVLVGLASAGVVAGLKGL
ncbi:COG2426 family protein [Thermus filiformis]|uniref:Small multidrug export protein n=1 Tax=Thermus filiformis TaxID=276 RepID=A0A0A2XAY5_THEFI|nr:small multi-drug export protein [Thermus filiformis]KGQ22349.1 small multidrug export protein [Thermus filiformis]